MFVTNIKPVPTSDFSQRFYVLVPIRNPILMSTQSTKGDNCYIIIELVVWCFVSGCWWMAEINSRDWTRFAIVSPVARLCSELSLAQVEIPLPTNSCPLDWPNSRLIRILCALVWERSLKIVQKHSNRLVLLLWFARFLYGIGLRVFDRADSISVSATVCSVCLSPQRSRFFCCTLGTNTHEAGRRRLFDAFINRLITLERSVCRLLIQSLTSNLVNTIQFFSPERSGSILSARLWVSLL